MSKIERLKNIELENKSLVILDKSVTSDVTLPKKFITFPYAYMNGRLHLGHASTIQSAEMQARFYKLCGYNVLFPFGYHGSGMPIVSAALKLERELNYAKTNNIKITAEYIKSLETSNQLKILFDMGVEVNELNNFIDPYNWILYFSKKAKSDVLCLTPFIDFSRSFFTTDMNKYYDSFITWQFNHLIKKGLVYKGTRNMIYSELDQQPCADHDRSTGENVDPIRVNTFIYNSYLVTIACDLENINTAKIVFGTNQFNTIILSKINTKIMVNQLGYDNIRKQFKVEYIGTEKFDNLVSNCPTWGTGVYLVSDDQKFVRNIDNIPNISFDNTVYDIHEYYEPEFEVLSRSGDKCIVAKTEQWFIDYGNKELKAKVLDYVKTEFVSSIVSVKEDILLAIENMHERACSRNFGLGTKLPNSNMIIDSLSDSTIYMAYYTISHIIEQLELDTVTHEMWDYVFLGIGETSNKLIIDMRKEFLYWYPVDIRVSGKDLIPSHLTYALFNHMAIWDDNKYMPKSYFVNGHLLLNGSKMSKSTGNFLTLKDAIDKYGSNSTRFALASFDGIVDGNFTDVNVLTGINKLSNELKFIEDLFNNGAYTGIECDQVECDYFHHQLKTVIKNVHEFYTNAEYGNVIKAFNSIISAKDEFVKKVKIVHTDEIKMYCNAMYIIMTPICPTWTKEIELIMKKNGLVVTIDWYETYSNPTIEKHKFLNHIIKRIKTDISRFKKPKFESKIIVEVIRNFSDEEKLVISNRNNLQLFCSTISDKVTMGLYRGYGTHVNNCIEEYGEIWLEWVNSSSLDEYNYILNNVCNIANGYKIEVVLVEVKPEYQFKNNPGRPKVSQVKI